MEITASKLDWLKSRKDFNTNPTARATARLLEHQYPHGDDLFPWISREVKRGNLKLPVEYERGWLKLAEMEMAAEQELARRQKLMDENLDYTHNPPEWADDSKDIDWDNLQIAPWNKLHDALDTWKRPRDLWADMNGVNGGLRFRVPNPMRPTPDPNLPGGGNQQHRFPDHPVQPEQLRKWEQILQDRAKRQKGVDPMQYTYGELATAMQPWESEWEEKQRAGLGQVVHTFPNGWTMRKVGPEEAAREGTEMGHCVGTEDYGYPDKMRQGRTHIFSLRDKANYPHTTLEISAPTWQDKLGQLPASLFFEHNLDPLDDRDRVRRWIGEVAEGYDYDEPLMTQRAINARALARKLVSGEYLKSQGAEPWHGGILRQVQGKENQTPIPPYQDMVRNWFDSMPQEQWPSNLADSRYHPDSTQAPESIYEQPPVQPPVQQFQARTEEHYPSPAHKNHQTGKICHCPWGPARDLWSWTSAIDLDQNNLTDTDNPPYEDWGWGTDDDDLSYLEQPQSFQDVVDMFGGTGLVTNFSERPGEVDMSLIDIPDERRGQGTGSRFMEAAHKYCQDHGKKLIVSEVDNVPFFSKFPFLNYQAQPGGRPRFVTAERVIPHKNLHQPCPTCHHEMVNGHCNQCEWSNLNPNIDSDPLSNPPDPTVDMHRGIQSSIIPSDHWAKWYEAAYETDSISWE